MVFRHFEHIWIRADKLDTPKSRKFQLSNQPIENLERVLQKYENYYGLYANELRIDVIREIARRNEKKE